MSGQPQPSRLAMPAPFPDDLFEAVKTRVSGAMLSTSPEQEHLGHAHIAVRYRLRACADYSDDFTRLIQQIGDEPNVGERRYQEERSLFGFFVSGYSVLDSFSFFMHTAASSIRPSDFPMQDSDLRQISCKQTPPRFARAFPNDTISNELNSLLGEQTFKELDRCRNTLAHRAAPGRVHYASFGTSTPDPPTEWKIDPSGSLKIDANLTPPRLAWLIATLAKLVSAADVFAQKHF